MGEQDGATEGGATDAPGLALCAVHALRFDPALTRGCVLCRRPAQPVVAAEAPRSGWSASTLLMAAGVGVLALVLVFDLGGDLAGVAATAARATPQNDRAPASARASAAKPAQKDAPAKTAAGDEPATACMRAARGDDSQVAANPAGRRDADENVTPLMTAATSGAAASTKALLAQGARPNAVDAHARTALMLAARANRSEAMAVLAAGGAVIEARCERGMTALHHAAEGSACTEGLARLLDLHADVEAVDTRGATALMLAARAGHAAVVRALLDRGARLEHRDYKGLGALDYLVMPRDGANAVAHADALAVLQLLVDRGVEPQLALDAATTPIALRADLDAWLRARGRPPLPAYAPPTDPAARTAARAGARDDDDAHGVLHLLHRSGPANSREAPTWLRAEARLIRPPWGPRVPNTLQQVRLHGLSLRTGQQVTLSADPAGNEPWEVDDALLIERMNGPLRTDSAFVGRPDAVLLDEQQVQRIGERAMSYTRGAIDFTRWFVADGRADRVVVSVLDWGQSAFVSDVYLHVIGPGAKHSVRGVEVETMRPR